MAKRVEEFDYQLEVERLLPALGATADKRDTVYRAVLDDLNQRFDLGLKPDEVAQLSLVLDALQAVDRFGDNEHISRGGNSAAHSLFSVVRMMHYLQRAGLTGGSEYEATLRRDLSLNLLVHDMGEGLIEPGTVTTEAQGGLKEIPGVEKAVFDFIMHFAAFSRDTGYTQYFQDNIRDMQHQMLSVKDRLQSGELTDTTLGTEILRMIQHHPMAFPQPLSEQSVETVRDLTVHYDRMELPGPKEFADRVAKLVEKEEGSLHFGALLQTNPKIPFTQASSHQIAFAARRLESGLPDLFAAVTALPQHRKKALRLAKAVRDGIYETVEQQLRDGPALLHRRCSFQTEGPAGPAQLALQDAYRDRHRTARAEERLAAGAIGGDDVASGGMFHPTETKLRLAATYHKAREVDYIPTHTDAIMQLRARPDALAVSQADLVRYSRESHAHQLTRSA